METNWKKRIQRPIGVYVTTFYVVFAIGILRLIGRFLEYREFAGDVEMPYVIIEFLLCLLTAGAAVWAFTGANEGRISLLVMLPLNLAWFGLWLLNAFVGDDVVLREAAFKSLFRSIGGIAIVIAIECYFLSKGVVAYYKQHDGNQKI